MSVELFAKGPKRPPWEAAAEEAASRKLPMNINEATGASLLLISDVSFGRNRNHGGILQVGTDEVSRRNYFPKSITDRFSFKERLGYSFSRRRSSSDCEEVQYVDRKSTPLNSSHTDTSRMPASASTQ